MGGLDPAKILVILLVAMIVLGPERLPRVARQLGGMWRELTKLREKFEDEVRGAMPDLDLPSIPVIPKGGLTGYLTGMMTSASSSRSPSATAAGAVTGEAGIAESGGDPALWGPGEAAGFTTAGWQAREGSRWDDAPSNASLPEGVPAGWQSVGATAPGYASGSLLSPVPTGSAPGLLDAETSFTFDEPSWN